MSPEWDWVSCVFAEKVRKTPDFVVKSGVFMCKYPNFEMLRPPGGVFPVKGVKGGSLDFIAMINAKNRFLRYAL